MTERYPTDATLLALASDEHTGVEYIPTGKSPYYLEFRKLVHRLLEATRRANDFRVYADGDLTVGVRSGRCHIAGSAVSFAGSGAIALTNNATTHLWLDSAGVVQTGTTGLPADRTSFIPLAAVTTDAGAITTIEDLRGEALWAAPDLQALGITATAQEIEQALSGIGAGVTAAALTRLTAGIDSNADPDHTHTRSYANVAGMYGFWIVNDSADPSARVLLAFDMPNALPDVTMLMVDMASGYLQQTYLGTAYHLVGTVHAQHRHEGALTASQTGKLIGVVPVDGVVSDVIVSVGQNIDSSLTTDGVSATVYVNGAAVTTTHPAITDAAGAGFRSTAQGHGTAAIVKSDGTEVVSRGDLLTVDLTRTAAGTITTEATDVVVLVVIRAARPE